MHADNILGYAIPANTMEFNGHFSNLAINKEKKLGDRINFMALGWNKLTHQSIDPNVKCGLALMQIELC